MGDIMRLNWLAGLIGVVWATAASAQIVVATPPKSGVEVGQGGQIVLQARQPFSSVAVGDPETVDALPRSDRTLVVVGKKTGVSDLIIFADGVPIHHVTVNVTSSPVVGKVLVHNKKDLSTYTAHQCNPVCSRVKDDFESKPPDVIILGPAGPLAAGTLSR
jgi:hypothetical protein